MTDTITPSYRYRARLLRVIDGDTYVFDVDLGTYQHHHMHVRLRGWGAAELNSVTGVLAQAAAIAVLGDQTCSIVIETYKDHQTFGRFVADVWVNNVPLSELLKDHLHPGQHVGVPHGQKGTAVW